MKLLALLGARVTVGTAVLADSHGMQSLVADRGFREFVTDFDQGFLRLESSGRTGQRTRERVARDAWARMLVPGWVSSSRLGTSAMVVGAAAALGAGVGDAAGRKQFKAEVDRVSLRFDLDQDARLVLLGTFEMLNWYATSNLAAAAERRASATYYGKLIEAAESRHLGADDYAALCRAIDYVNDRAQDRATRSAVLAALASDPALDRRLRDEIRATVSSAWMTAMSDGSSGRVSLTLPLPSGVMVARILDEPAEAFVDIENLDHLLGRNPVFRVEDTITANLARMSWHQVAGLVDKTRTTRDPVTRMLDSGQDADREVIAVHRRAIKRALGKAYPPLTRAEVASFTVNLVSAGVAHGSAIRFAGPALAAAEAARSSLRWTGGRFIAGTLNRLANRISAGDSRQ